jgi:hypothetical protein
MDRLRRSASEFSRRALKELAARGINDVGVPATIGDGTWLMARLEWKVLLERRRTLLDR